MKATGIGETGTGTGRETEMEEEMMAMMVIELGKGTRIVDMREMGEMATEKKILIMRVDRTIIEIREVS